MLDWNQFRKLTGDPRLNFERLWRQLIGCRYGAYGVFREYKNMQGVEFVLELTRDCNALGKKGDKIGWQCKFIDQLGAKGEFPPSKRGLFVESLEKISIPLSKCFLCTYASKLSADDMRWIEGLSKKMSLPLEWQTSENLDTLLNCIPGGSVLREVYFGDLVLGDGELRQALVQSIEQVRHRYIPEVISQTRVEQILQTMLLGNKGGYFKYRKIEESVWAGTGEDSVLARIIKAEDWVRKGIHKDGSGFLNGVSERLNALEENRKWELFYAKNPMVGVMADAGCGKTCLGISICMEVPNVRPTGAFFRAKDLVGRDINSLAHTFKFRMRNAQTMDEVLCALDVAGRICDCKMPLVIDGLNESQYPADWKDVLSGLTARIKNYYPHVLLIATFRSGGVAGRPYHGHIQNEQDEQRFVYQNMCMPIRSGGDSYPILELSRWDAEKMKKKYFQYYRIDVEDEVLPDVLCHPLALSIYCQIVNNDRRQRKRIAQLPRLMSSVFEGYREKVVENLVNNQSRVNITPQDASNATILLGKAFYESGTRYVDSVKITSAVKSGGLDYSIDWPRVFSEEGLVVENIVNGRSVYESTYDSLCGYLVAKYILLCNLKSDSWVKHELVDDVSASLVPLYASKHDRQFVRDVFPTVGRFHFAKHVVHLPEELVGDWGRKELLYAIAKDDAIRGAAIDKCLAHFGEEGKLYGAAVLDAALADLPMAKRDVIWGTRIWKHSEVLRNRLWDINPNNDIYMLTSCKWLLASTCITVRDRATHILHDIGLRNPKSVLDTVISSFSVNDGYIVERMAAVGYATCLCINIARSRADWDALILNYSEQVIQKCLAKGAPFPTSNKWTLDALVNTIALARHIDGAAKSCVIRKFRLPYRAWYNPFRMRINGTGKIISQVERAFDHDFLYYKLPHLIGAFNYKTESKGYITTKARIACRMHDMGFRYIDFEQYDRYVRNQTAQDGNAGNGFCYEEFGKKYVAIAYAEMKIWTKRESKDALIFDADKLNPRYIRDYAREIPSYWTPYFWPEHKAFPGRLPEMVSGQESGMPTWLKEGGVPCMENVLSGDIFGDGQEWVLLHGFIEQEREGKYRITFRTDGVLTTDSGINRIENNGAENTDYNAREYHEAIYWEMPWSRQCTYNPNSGDTDSYALGPNVCGDVEVPYCSIGTGSRNESSKEDVSRFAYLPDLFLINTLDLKPSVEDLCWFSPDGSVATRYYAKFDRTDRNDPDNYQLLYIRRDLLEKYTQIRGLKFVQRCFGERYPGLDLIDADINYIRNSGIDYHDKQFAHIRRPIADNTISESFEEIARRVMKQCPSVKAVIAQNDDMGNYLHWRQEEDDEQAVWPIGRYADDELMFFGGKGIRFYCALPSAGDNLIQVRRMYLEDKRSIFILGNGHDLKEKSFREAIKTILHIPKSFCWYVSWLIVRQKKKLSEKWSKWNERHKQPLIVPGFNIKDIILPIRKGEGLHIVPCCDETNGVYVVTKRLADADGVSVVECGKDVAKTIRKSKAYEIWVHGMWLPKEWFACLCVLKAKKRLVRMTHGSLSPIYLKRQSPVKKLLVGPIEKYLLRHSSKIVVTCGEEKIWVENYLGRACPFIEVFDPKQLFNLSAFKSNTLIRKRPLHLLYLGRKHPLKGLEFLDAAVKDIDGVELRVVSNALGDQKEKAWEWCDVLVLPTLSDNFGLVIAEALERGKRVITTDGAPAWNHEIHETHEKGVWSGYGGRLIYLKGYRDGTDEERVELLKKAIERICE